MCIGSDCVSQAFRIYTQQEKGSRHVIIVIVIAVVVVFVVVTPSDEQEACPIIDFSSHLLSDLKEHCNTLYCI